MFKAFSDADLDSVEAHGVVRLSEDMLPDLVTNFQAVQRSWPRRELDIIAAHLGDERLVIAHLNIGTPRHQDEGLLLNINADSESFGFEGRPNRHLRSLSRKVEVLGDALEVLGPLTRETRLHCRGRWFLDNSEWSPIISLPVIRTDIPGTPYQQVSGVRLSPGRLNTPDYAILDMETQDIFSVSIGFGITMTGGISREIFNRVASKAQKLKERVVVAVKPEEDSEDDNHITK